jgi:ribonucleoside-diphosphate reductase alpha chain
MYSKKQVYDETLSYFNGDTLAADVFLKYALQDKDGSYLEKTPRDMHKRLAREFARIELKYPNPMSEGEIFELLDNFKYVIPQGSPMSGIGNNNQIQSLSNCFVNQNVGDSYGSILKTDQELVQIMKRRGGVGVDISEIRPKGMTTSNSAKTTDGIEVFMERFSNSTREVAQGGRRGALMLTISCNHPQVDDFIKSKLDLKKVTGANISVRWTDEFLNAVQNDQEYTLRWPVKSSIENAKFTKTVRAKEIWDLFIDSSYKSAEPGGLFWDTVIRESIADCYNDVGFETISTNPCSELPLPEDDSCRLIVNNLLSFVNNKFTDSAEFDYKKFYEIVVKSQRLMDDLVDLEAESIDKIIKKIESDPESDEVKFLELNLWKKKKQKALLGRRTGLGVTAVGDTLAALNIRYGSPKSILVTEEIFKAFAVASHTSSIILAEERGSFPSYDYNKEKDHAYLNRILNECSLHIQHKWKKFGRRNIANTTLAPCGSVSIETQTTSGIESLFLISHMRRRKMVQGDTFEPDFVDSMGDKWQEYVVYHHGFSEWMRITGKTNVEDSPYWKSTSNDVDWLMSVELQAAAQKWIDHGISKTCNLPNDVSKQTISDAYLKAWKLGCKGFTVYRDGSRSGVLVSVDEKKKETAQTVSAEKRKKELPCDIHRVTIKGESWLVLVGMNEKVPYEVFCGIADNIEVPKKIKNGTIIKNGKKDGVTTYNLRVPIGDDDEILFKDIVNLFANPTQGALTRTISLALRHSIPIQFIVEQIQKEKDMFSFSKSLARVLKTYIPDGTKAANGEDCPECNSKLLYQEGCKTCVNCGWSKCS